MTAAEILALYDAEMRADPPPEMAVRHERVGAILRAMGSEHAIIFSNLNAMDADGAIAGQAAFFRSIGAGVEWKVYGHDLPADLDRRLRAAGFKPQERETLMAFDLAEGLPGGPVPAGIEIRRITTAAGLEDLIAVSSAAFGRDDRWKIDAFRTRLVDPALGLYVAYAEGRPVSGARVELAPGRSFAGLWGGGTLPGYRGRGIYRGLVAARAREALRRGYRYLTVDARETSRPILERLGFSVLTSIRGWRLKPK
jgi:GNAT superfamily N-acetyltransferase